MNERYTSVEEYKKTLYDMYKEYYKEPKIPYVREEHKNSDWAMLGFGVGTWYARSPKRTT